MLYIFLFFYALEMVYYIIWLEMPQRIKTTIGDFRCYFTHLRRRPDVWWFRVQFPIRKKRLVFFLIRHLFSFLSQSILHEIMISLTLVRFGIFHFCKLSHFFHLNSLRKGHKIRIRLVNIKIKYINSKGMKYILTWNFVYSI